MKDVFQSGEMFTESGYLTSTQSYPGTIEELYGETVDCIGLIMEVGACHLVCEIQFKKIKGTISKDTVKNFIEKMWKLSESAKDKLRRTKIDLGELEAMEMGKEHLEEAQLAF